MRAKARRLEPRSGGGKLLRRRDAGAEVDFAGTRESKIISGRATAVRSGATDLGLVTASVAQPGWIAGISGPLPLPSPEQPPEMEACGAVGVARQRRTPGNFVVLCYAGS